jgi:glycosyltransferase involved in cell wall biosynthesis
VAAALDQNEIGILHVHGYKATVYAATASYRRRMLTVFKTEHGLPEPASRLSASRWRNSFYFAAEAVATRRMRASVFYVSNDLREHYRRIHSGLRTAVIPNGVHSMSADTFARPTDLPARRFNVLLAGRVDIIKGHSFAVQAIARLKMNADAHLNIIGEGPRTNHVSELAHACGVADRVHVLGFRRNAYDYLAHSDVVLMPSLHEGLPYTLLEAMALAKPIIASRVGGLAETLEDGVTALLVAPRDPDAIAQALTRLRRDPGFGSRLGDNARRVQRARYSVEAMTASYLTHYRMQGLSGGALTHAV